MTTTTEALKLAIDTQDAIRNFVGSHGQENTATFLLMEADRALSAVRAAIAQPQPSAALLPAREPQSDAQIEIATGVGTGSLWWPVVSGVFRQAERSHGITADPAAQSSTKESVHE